MTAMLWGLSYDFWIFIAGGCFFILLFILLAIAIAIFLWACKKWPL